jgi:subtilisin
VAASGNNGSYGLDYPARYPEVISVGAINQKNQVSEFSQFGPNLDIVAPGEAILSTWLDNRYNTISGTSMACAHVSGALALILSAKPSITSTQAKRILLTDTERLHTTGAAQGKGLLSITSIIKALRT